MIVLPLAFAAFLVIFGILVFFTVVIVAIFIYVYIRESMSKDRRPPIAGSILNDFLNFNTLFDHQTTLARKHTTYRNVTPTCSEIYTVDPANVEHILKTNFTNYVKGELTFGVMKDLFGEGIFAVDGDKWRHQRKLASYEFSTRNLRDFSSNVFRVNAAKLVSKVSEAAKIIDIQDMLMKSTLDSIFKVAFGVDLGSLIGGFDEFGKRFTKAFDDSNMIVFWRYVDLTWKIKRFLNIGLEASLKQNLQIIDDFVFELVRRKREQMRLETLDSSTSKEDILSRFLIESEKDPEHMTDKYLRDIILSFMIAGKDTTANTLTWFFYLLCKNPLVQEKIVDEVREMTTNGHKDIVSPEEFAESVTEEALSQMHYLHAAITETLRLYPAVPMDGKYSEEDDILPDGYKVNKGDGINYLTYAMGRMKHIWGDDAEEFRPERWLDHGVFRPESPFKFTAFHAGPRICLGKEFAYRQMKILACVLLNFIKFKLVDESKEAKYRTMFTLHMYNGLHLFALPRV